MMVTEMIGKAGRVVVKDDQVDKLKKRGYKIVKDDAKPAKPKRNLA